MNRKRVAIVIGHHQMKMKDIIILLWLGRVSCFDQEHTTTKEQARENLLILSENLNIMALSFSLEPPTSILLLVTTTLYHHKMCVGK